MVGKWKPTRGCRRLQMLEDLYENKSYDEVLKRTAEDRRAWRNCMRKKVPKKTAVQQTTEEEQQ